MEDKTAKKADRMEDQLERTKRVRLSAVGRSRQTRASKFEKQAPKVSIHTSFPKKNKNANEKKSKNHGGGIKMGVNNVG